MKVEVDVLGSCPKQSFLWERKAILEEEEEACMVRKSVWTSGKTGKQKDLGSIPFCLSSLFKSCGLWTLSF